MQCIDMIIESCITLQKIYSVIFFFFNCWELVLLTCNTNRFRLSFKKCSFNLLKSYIDIIFQKSMLLNLIQEIEPLDMSLIQKDVPANTVDAMKRTISGMLGLLPSNQFHVQVEALWESLFKLFVSSMKTGYAYAKKMCFAFYLNNF